ncbi:MAG: ComEC/Rec2 family competence protein [Candidatus Babeliales bacterium]
MVTIPLTFNQIVFHPLFFITHACIIGIAWHYTQAHVLFIALGACIITALYCTRLYRKPIIIICMIISFFLGAYRHYAVHATHTHWISQLQTGPADIVATVTDQQTVDHPLYKQRLTLFLRTCANPIFLYTKACPSIHVDDTLIIRNITIKQPSSPSYHQYLLKEGVLATIFTAEIDYTCVYRPHYSYTRWLHALKNNTLQSLAYKMAAQPYHLFASLFLGNKPIPKKTLELTKEHFNTWGVSHYLARSGLHMIIIGMVWHMLVSFLPLSYAVRTLLLILLSIVYGLLSWPTISFNRALISFILYKLCDFLRTPTHFLHTVTVVCLAVIIHNPLQIFFLDFQLSFGLTCALALFSHLKQKSPNY